MHAPVASAARRLLAIAAVAAAAAAGAAPLPLLRITDLSASTGIANSRAGDINNNGVVLGAETRGSAYLWKPGTPPQTFHPPRGYDLDVNGLNDDGVVVGRLIYTNNGNSKPFTWTAAGGLDRIELRRHQHYGNATAVNNQGEIVGSATVKVGQGWRVHALIGSVSLGLDDPRHTRQGDSEARALNNLGHAGGAASPAQGCCHSAVLMDRRGRFTWLGTLAGADEPDDSVVNGLNDADEAVGSSDVGGQAHAFYWSPATGMRPLQVHPDGDDWSIGLDINRQGEVVGNYGRGDMSSSFYWNAEHGAVDLQALLDPADPLTAKTRIGNHGARINDRGEIVVNATVAGQGTAVLLTPVRH